MTQHSEPQKCRRCSECQGMSHHWMENSNFAMDESCGEFFDPDEPTDCTHICKHCDARGEECGICGGEGCSACGGEGVVELLPDHPARIIEGKTPWEFACAWYTPDEIERSLAECWRPSVASDPSKNCPPENVRSREFAEWLCDQYRLAMNKGIQIGVARHA